MTSRLASFAAAGILAGCTAQHPQTATVVEPLPQATVAPAPVIVHLPPRRDPTDAVSICEIDPHACDPTQKASCSAKTSCSGKASCAGHP